MHFEDFGLMEPLLRAVRSEGYTQPTPIQEQAIPDVLKGKDLLGCAQTGTGKTAAFALPILQRLSGTEHRAAVQGAAPRPIRALVITPTRELAAQIGESFVVYGKHLHLECTVVYGGVGQAPQVKALKRGVDILVATPGRLLDLIGQNVVKLQAVEVLVLDEADRMLDMGFIIDIRKVIAFLPKRRQTLLFSATMPSKIQSLADSILHDPVEVRVAQESPAADTVDHSVYFVDQQNKQSVLERLLADATITRALVFTRTKHGADRVTRRLSKSSISAEAIHSNKTQVARERALDNFKHGKTRVLVASDIAARGLDVDDISHVINFDLPNEAEVYVHRIGRTGRAGATGKAVSLCGIDERTLLLEIERLIRQPLRTMSVAQLFTSEEDWLPNAPSKPAPPREDDESPRRHEGRPSRERQGRQQGRPQRRDQRPDAPRHEKPQPQHGIPRHEEPVQAQAEHEPAGHAIPDQHEAARRDRPKHEMARPRQAERQHAEHEPVRAERPKQELARPRPAEHPRTEHAAPGPEPARVEQPRQEPARPRQTDREGIRHSQRRREPVRQDVVPQDDKIRFPVRELPADGDEDDEQDNRKVEHLDWGILGRAALQDVDAVFADDGPDDGPDASAEAPSLKKRRHRGGRRHKAPGTGTTGGGGRSDGGVGGDAPA